MSPRTPLYRLALAAALGLIACGLATIAAAGTFDVRMHGAMGRGETLDTAAIQRAIDAAHAAGGGTVVFRPGTYLTADFALRSRVTIHLEAGAILRASTRVADYGRKSLILADGLEYAGIEGRGIIDGQGDTYHDGSTGSEEWRARPEIVPFGRMILIQESSNIRIEGITILRSPHWTLHLKHSRNVSIRGVTIRNNTRVAFNDGIDIDGCQSVRISDCHIETGDDGIVLKTKRDRPDSPIRHCEDIVVTGCVLRCSPAALKLGTESHGDFRNILFSDCALETRNGLTIVVRDGGTVENVRFNNIVIRPIPADDVVPKWRSDVRLPIKILLEKRTASSRLGRIRDVSFSNLSIQSPGRVLVEGLPGHPIDFVRFSDVLLRVTDYENLRDAPKKYNGVSKYRSTPAAMIFAHVKTAELNDVRLFWPENRPNPPDRDALFTDHVATLDLSNVRAP
ncbi:MAG: glycosyl hydrolase family 28 protein, partial [Verrucomicrobiota bacterium]